MTFEFIDRNTYIQRPIYETKDASSKLDLKDVKVFNKQHRKHQICAFFCASY